MYGCIIPFADNYSTDANTNDDSVYDNLVQGCTNETAINYNNNATLDGSLCLIYIPGCTDPNFIEFNPEANLIIHVLLLGKRHISKV